MNNEYKVEYSKDFFYELDNIVYYIKNILNNEIAANNFIDKVEEKIKERALNPHGYEKFKTKNSNIYYRIYSKNFVIFYTISGQKMIVRRIIYGKRNLSKLL